MPNEVAEITEKEHQSENVDGMTALVHGHDGSNWVRLLVTSAGAVEIA